MKYGGNRTSSPRWLSGIALAGAGLLAFAAAATLSSSVDESEGDVVAPVERAAPAFKTGTPALSGEAIAARPAIAERPERLNERVAHNPFSALSLKAEVVPVHEPPAPASKTKKPKIKAPEPEGPSQPPAPVAPPLPFTAVGSIAGAEVTGGGPVAFVRQHDKLLLVRAGDVIGQTYRVGSITAQKIEFIYLPLMQHQWLALAP